MYFKVFLFTIFFSSFSLLANEKTVETHVHMGQELLWKGPSGRGVGLGYAHGLWGQAFAQEINSIIPFWQSMYGSTGMRARTILVHQREAGFNLGGRLEFYGSSPVLLNVIRLYGGGGYQFFHPVGKNNPFSKKMQHGMGGYYGFEFFFRDYMAFTIEIGGQGGKDAGPSIMGGVSFYPFTRF